MHAIKVTEHPEKILTTQTFIMGGPLSDPGFWFCAALQAQTVRFTVAGQACSGLPLPMMSSNWFKSTMT